MLRCGAHHLRRSEDRLHCEIQREFPGKPAGDAAIGERLDHQADISGTAPAQTGHRVEQLLGNRIDYADA